LTETASGTVRAAVPDVDPESAYPQPELPLASAGAPADSSLVAAQWTAIDRVDALQCAISPCSQLAHVPDAFRTDWARAQSEVFAILLDGFALWRASGDRSALDRGLKWHLALSAILLRGRRRAGRRGDVAVAQRFGHWCAGRRDLLVRLWLDDRGRSAEYRRLRAESSTPDPAATIERVLEHIDDGELSRALRLLHSAGKVDEGVLAQLRAKHPERGEPVPAAIEGDFTRHRFDLTEHFRRLRRSAGGCGT